MSVFNFIGKNFNPQTDSVLFHDTDELLPILESESTMAQLLARIGKFPSVGEAKRNGWAKSIPSGWSEFVIGKGAKRIDVFIWNPTTSGK